MKEYIERKALIDKIFPIGMIDDGRYAIPAKAVKTAIDNAPAADVVEVVRCRDCKNYREYRFKNEPTGWGKCTAIAMDIDLAANDFCCYGERKEK